MFKPLPGRHGPDGWRGRWWGGGR